MTPNPLNEPGSRGPGQPLMQLGRPQLRVIRMLALLVAAVIGAGCGDPGSGSPNGFQQGDGSAGEKPWFRTEYEPDETAGTPAVAITLLTFQNLGTGQSPINFDIQYLGGIVPDRHATLVADPTQPGGTGPVGLTHWNPQMMYSSDNVLHHIRDSGGVAQVYWDDFEFSFGWPPGW